MAKMNTLATSFEFVVSGRWSLKFRLTLTRKRVKRKTDQSQRVVVVKNSALLPHILAWCCLFSFQPAVTTPRLQAQWEINDNKNQMTNNDKINHLSHLSAVSQIYILSRSAPAFHNRWVESRNWRTDENKWVQLWQASVSDTSHSCLPDLWVMFARHTARHMHVIQTDSPSVRPVADQGGGGGEWWHPLWKHFW